MKGLILFCSLFFLQNALAAGNWVANLSLGAESNDKSDEKDSTGQARSTTYGGLVGVLGLETPTFLGLAIDIRGLLATEGGKFTYHHVKDGVTYTDQRLQGSLVRAELGGGLKWNFINFDKFRLFVGAMAMIGSAGIAYDPINYAEHHSNSDGYLASEDQSYSGMTYRTGIDFFGTDYGFRLSAELAKFKTKAFETLENSRITHAKWQFLIGYLQRF